MGFVSTTTFAPLRDGWPSEKAEAAAGSDLVDAAAGPGGLDAEAPLYYHYQSGAINESYADVFGELIDLSRHELDGHFLEGTGSLVLDRVNHIAYACLSSRTQLDPMGDFAQQMGYEVVAFEAVDRDGIPIYHTNVLMNVGEALAVVCDEAIPREDQRTAVLQRLRDTGHDILSIDYDQLDAFAGNMLELRNRDGDRVVALSRRAYDALSEAQRERLEQNGKIVVASIDTIEASAGGSVRCMLAEVHFPESA